MTARLLLAALLLALIQGAVIFVRQQREPENVREPAVGLDTFPLRIGSWSGTDAEIDPRLRSAIGASSVVDRIYENNSGSKLVFEVAAFVGNQEELSHMPQTCYTNVGYTIKEQRDVELRVSGEAPRKARILCFEQDRQRIYVLYWYQLGDDHVLDYNGLRRARWSLFGEKTWPPTIKVMIQSNQPDAALAEEQLTLFAESVLDWSKQL